MYLKFCECSQFTALLLYSETVGESQTETRSFLLFMMYYTFESVEHLIYCFVIRIIWKCMIPFFAKQTVTHLHTNIV